MLRVLTLIFRYRKVLLLFFFLFPCWRSSRFNLIDLDFQRVDDLLRGLITVFTFYSLFLWRVKPKFVVWEMSSKFNFIGFIGCLDEGRWLLPVVGLAYFYVTLLRQRWVFGIACVRRYYVHEIAWIKNINCKLFFHLFLYSVFVSVGLNKILFRLVTFWNRSNTLVTTICRFLTFLICQSLRYLLSKWELIFLVIYRPGLTGEAISVSSFKIVSCVRWVEISCLVHESLRQESWFKVTFCICIHIILTF